MYKHSFVFLFQKASARECCNFADVLSTLQLKSMLFLLLFYADC